MESRISKKMDSLEKEYTKGNIPAQYEIELVGHLINEGAFNKTLDLITEKGGTFKVIEFSPGKYHEDPSRARLSVSGVDPALLDVIQGDAHVSECHVYIGEQDALVETVDIDGTAPLDYYATTIFPTEVRVNGNWLLSERQRMDAAIVIEKGPEDSKPRAICRLIRDLRIGDQVVCGNEGIKMILPESKESEGGFKFMGAGVSSERRVEPSVDAIAKEMRDIKARGGRIAVVAGPVCVHTGGVEPLSDLVRAGYVQTLLGGNAIAVHDIERDQYGTSLGVNLKEGHVVEGGHRHHIKTINLIRRCGSIKAAVEQGVIKSGIMKTLVECNVPFVLAGSIRDDGPLPDTIMDLIEAQRLYQEQMYGVELVLMLSSMLHSIGVGNMTPSGVKMICVDINPAVATKLADRGSLESVGLVTDVGLFLRLLAEKLRD